MRTLYVLGLCLGLANLAGCAWDGAEAAQSQPATTAAASPSTATPAGQELYRMFPEEKAHAQVYELPPQF